MGEGWLPSPYLAVCTSVFHGFPWPGRRPRFGRKAKCTWWGLSEGIQQEPSGRICRLQFPFGMKEKGLAMQGPPGLELGMHGFPFQGTRS